MNQHFLSEKELFISKRAGKYIVKRPLIGYKVVKCTCRTEEFEQTSNRIAELEIPTNASIVRPINTFLPNYLRSQLRTNRIILKNIEVEPFNINECTCYSFYNKEYIYNVGKEHEPESFDEDINKECAAGIYLFLGRKEAEEYSNVLNKTMKK